MFWWGPERKKRKLLGLKNIRVNGMRFTIRRVNPIMDFPAAQVPQLFAESSAVARTLDNNSLTPVQIENIRKTVLSYIHAGVVEPRLVPIGAGDKRGKEPGITAEDLFRDPSMGMKLYHAILENSLNAFSGLRGVFFSIRTRLSLFISLHLSTAVLQSMLWQGAESRQNSSAKPSTSLS